MIKNAILYVLRKKKRTCILFIILTTVLSFLYSSLNIMKLSNNLENDLYKISNTSISITQKDNQNFEINQFKEMENIQEIKEIIPQYDCLAKATNVEVVDGIQKVERENLPEILKNTFSIESTNSTKNNVLFNSGIFTIIDGRHIEKNDREKILIHEELAKKNNLKIGALLSGFILIFLIAWKISEMFFPILPVYVFAVNKLFRRSMIFSLLFTIGMTLFVYGLFAKGFTIRFMP